MFRANQYKCKRERQNTNVERTNVKKMCNSTVMNYFELQEIMKDIRRGIYNEKTTDEII